MKPESHRALMELISYGVEELSNEDAAQLMSRVHDCQECTGQWVLFQKTYTVLSQTGQSEVSVERSQQMWLTCLEHAKHKPNSHHLVAAQIVETLDHESQSEVVPVSFRSDSSQREEDRRPSPAFHPFQFLKQQLLRHQFLPRLPYALAAGSFALLAAAYFVPPRSDFNAPRLTSEIALPASEVAPRPDRFVPAPHATTGLIDYHSEMSFEPFSDHLAPSLIAANATRP